MAGGLKIIGNWLQTKPEDLSQEAIRWYTWGFSNRAIFAVRVERVKGEKTLVRINAQACDAKTCQMVRGAVLTLPLDAVESFSQNTTRSSIDFDELIEAARASEEGTQTSSVQTGRNGGQQEEESRALLN